MALADASPPDRSALVVGAGLAGLTAALDLVDAGWRVTLLERRPFAGGRTFSFANDAGDILDNGQHVFLGCCSAYIGLLARLGRSGKAHLQRQLSVTFVDDELGQARLQAARLPAPLHLLPSFFRLPYLTPAEKARAIGALLVMRVRDLPENQTFASWLAGHGQTPNAIARLWNLITVPTCNAPADRVSARMGGFVFREGLLRSAGGGRIGYSRVGLSELIPDAAVAYLRAHGASLRFETAIKEVCLAGDVFEAVATASGARLEAAACVVALPPAELVQVLPAGWAAPAATLPLAPIVGVNLWYDRPIFSGDLLALIAGGQGFWLFDRTRILGRGGGEHHIAVSISAAEEFMEKRRQDLPELVAGLIARALPEARKAVLLRSGVSKVRGATFVPAPGAAGARLPQRTPIRNLYLAGSWTDTGWPDTMESAVRSGHEAARLAISRS